MSLNERYNIWHDQREMWGNYPDDYPLHTLALKGDSRAALAPFLAARQAHPLTIHCPHAHPPSPLHAAGAHLNDHVHVASLAYEFV